ncbi:Asp-tRNA(Asn)/Glu-tRNA(Gln) amidotransferase subunit GatC [Patescibacteria group bacterium]|jgi:aspartyl-tRNA(Asn)/glutamyl-tRNA(Gln) amidotransferase subunit C|nr:Asp-tRNA(Asn)/Glu-tRNA(Gln) amidotransferase subunit GatC [Patescibacteria group bacterium]
MALTREDVLQLAALSRLSLSEEELKKMESTLDPILEYVGRLSKIDTKDVPETEAAPVPSGELRLDVPTPVEESFRRAVLKNFPDHQADLLRVPGVFENPKG